MNPKNIHYENGSMGSLMVWILENDDRLIQYQLQLLARQRPPYLLTCLLRYRFDLPQLCQDISGLVPLDQVNSGKEFHSEKGREIIKSIAEALNDSADRLLPIRQISLNPSMIYLDRDFHVRLAFWPICAKTDPAALVSEDCEPENPHQDLNRLIQQIGSAFRMPPDEIAVILQSLADGGIQKTISFMNGSGLLQGSRNPSDSGLKQMESGITHGIKDPIQTMLMKIKQYVRCGLLSIKSILAGQDGDESQPGDYQTVLLTDNPDEFRMAMLSEGQPGTPEESEGTRSFILVDEFVIGRDQKTSDLCLHDPGVGRMHARIIRRAGSFFICDMGSRNGTKLDGRKLLKHIEQLLPDQCVLQFAERPFYFHTDGSG
jgi:hypothetical protein